MLRDEGRHEATAYTSNRLGPVMQCMVPGSLLAYKLLRTPNKATVSGTQQTKNANTKPHTMGVGPLLSL
eukprot:scaffold34204_cov39-Attheya_sp.AAC.1